MELNNSLIISKYTVNLYDDYNYSRVLEQAAISKTSVCLPEAMHLDFFRKRTNVILELALTSIFHRNLKLKKSPTLYKRLIWRTYK